jgi:hypothetical protein
VERGRTELCGYGEERESFERLVLLFALAKRFEVEVLVNVSTSGALCVES